LNNQIVPQRQPVTATELETLVDPIIDGWITSKQDFTSWAVTVQLRNDNPTLEIEHDSVRVVVRDNMEERIRNQLIYNAVTDYRHGTLALTFEPGNIIQVGAQVVKNVAKRLSIPKAPWSLDDEDE